MFDTATCTEAVKRWAAWQRDAQMHPGGFGHLPDSAGPGLAGALDMWEPGTRSDQELIDRIGSWEKVKAWAEAGQLAEIAELAARRRAADARERAEHAARGGQGEPGQLMEFVVDEVALAGRLSRVAASHRLDLAQDLTRSLPQVFAALQAGDIDLVRARIIAEGTRSLDRDVRVAVADAVLNRAPQQTPGAVRAAVARAVHIVDPAGVEDRHTADRADRRVTLIPRDNGMSELCAFLPADGAAAIMAHPAPPGRNLAYPGRPEDQRPAHRRPAPSRRPDRPGHRLPRHPPRPAPHTRPSRSRRPGRTRRPGRNRRPGRSHRPGGTAAAPLNAAAAGLGPGPGRVPGQPAHRGRTRTGELLGYGPIPTSMAYRIAADATWQRLLTDPATGALLDVGRTRYTPPAALAEFGITRDRACRFPGCRQPRTDLDHTIAYPPGPPPTTTSPACADTTTGSNNTPDGKPTSNPKPG